MRHIKLFESYDSTTYYHGSTGKDMSGKNGIHIGTEEAAKQALEARIGVPTSGSWDGTREYGKTLLAGRKSLAKPENKWKSTGYNTGSDLPEDDYYPGDRTYKATYSDRTPVSLDSKPIIFAVKIIGQMSNTPQNPHEDFKANGYMIRALKKGNVKSGYYYENVAEDEGSISAEQNFFANIMRHTNDEGGYFQTNEELHFKEGKYVPENFKKGPNGDIGLHDDSLQESVNESGYKENGIVLIKGNQLPNGKYPLYGAHIKQVLSYQRIKMGGDEGQAAKMVLLHDDLFRIKVADRKLHTLKTMEKFERTGLKSKRIVLNNNKTPKHWLTTKYTNFPKLFTELVDDLRNMSDIEWYN